MKCLVINLDRSPERLAHMRAGFGRIGIAFERVVAIDGYSHPELKQQAQHPMYGARQLSSSEIACLHSHRACWSILVQDEARYGAVFEDDVVFSANAGRLLADSDWIPADADIVKLETFFKKTMIHRMRISARHGFSMYRLCRFHPGTGGYIVSRRAARDLLDATEKVNLTADDMVFNPAFSPSGGKMIYQLVPALCAQAQFLGSIGAGLPSLLDQERETARVASGLAIKRRRPFFEKMRVETRRIVEWVVDHCRLRRYTIVALDPPEAGR
ncbi:glycosyltransferase family 25 protein [Mesorhizobium sp. ES1-4]|uniref:glycosyltransferase family 25 protein n=1 Tax=Mesorhizobium sp. ES1-4 TaxID=2876627 RepID=UPI001CC9CD48|nr:glycosyltransferase family 25 protein [Mesorhizobium sp. ES1-4]MBZ9798890.1 glycosyltransferase family 25 protein [Mesorhizobium sp. ES1-4]